MENGDGVRRAVLYTLSGGFVSVAFALLGAAAAEAKTIPDGASGAPAPKDTALKVASAVPGMGVLKAADTARKVTESAAKTPAPPKKSTPVRDTAAKADSSSKKDAAKRDAAVRVASSVPGMGALKAVDAARKVSASAKDGQSGSSKSRSTKDEAKRDAAVRVASAVPGMGALKAVDAARKVADSGGGKSPVRSARSGDPTEKDVRSALAAAGAVPGMRSLNAVQAARKVAENPAQRDRTALAAASAVPGLGVLKVAGEAAAHAKSRRTVVPAQHRVPGTVAAFKADDGLPLPPPSPIPFTPFCQGQEGCERGQTWFAQRVLELAAAADKYGVHVKSEGSDVDGEVTPPDLPKGKLLGAEGHADYDHGTWSAGNGAVGGEYHVGLKGEGTLSVGKDRIGADAEVKAGVTASLPEYTLPLGPITFKASPEAWLGFGAKAGAGIEVTDDRKVRFKTKQGVSPGIGGSLGLEVEVDQQALEDELFGH